MENVIETGNEIANFKFNTKGKLLSISFPTEKKIIMYDQIKLMGFGYSAFNKRKVYILRSEVGIEIVNFKQIKLAFTEFLKSLRSADMTKLLNAFYQRSPLKESNILKQILETELTERELFLLNSNLKS